MLKWQFLKPLTFTIFFLGMHLDKFCPPDPFLCEKGTFKIQKLYIELWMKFHKYIQSKQCYDELYYSTVTLFELTEDHDVCRERELKKLLRYIFEKQSYLNYFILKEIITQCGSQEDKLRLTRYDVEYSDYICNRRFKISPESFVNHRQGFYTTRFVIDRRQHRIILKDIQRFIYRIGEMFGVDPRKIHLHTLEQGSLIIGLLFPELEDIRSSFVCTSLYSKRITSLKNDEHIRTIIIEGHNLDLELNLQNWNVLDDVTVKNNILGDNYQQSMVRKADIAGQACMALEYSTETTSAEGYVKYLAGLLNAGHDPCLPTIKGLYYRQPGSDRRQYPLVIIEDYEMMKDAITHDQSVEEVEQVSYILDIASCIYILMKPSKSVKISVKSDAVFFSKESKQSKAILLPLYGYTYTWQTQQMLQLSQAMSTQIDSRSQDMLQSSQELSLPLEELTWIRTITEFLNRDHSRRNQNKLMQRIDQRWLSENYRPHDFEELCEELQDLRGK